MMATAQRQLADSVFSKEQILISMASIFIGYFVYGYVMQTLNVANPRMAADLDGMALYSWIVSIPGLGLAVGTLLSGKLSDIYGRRVILSGSMIVSLLGTILSALSPTFVTLIAARTILFLGLGALAPLCYTVIGDIFTGSNERGKWIGLLNIPMGIPCLLGPTFSGWIVDNLNWRHIFWWILPVNLLVILIMYGMPSLIQGAARKIDIIGIILATIASSALIFGLSFAGTTYPWRSMEVIFLLVIALGFGALFLRAESKAGEPILDLELLRNRTFMTASVAGFLSFFGMTAMMLYYPLLMQGIQGLSAMKSGEIITPLGALMSFIGVPTGFLIARTKRYKWMLITGYAMVTVVMFGMIFVDQDTPVFWGVMASTLTGLGLGAIPTINTLIVQAAVPRRLLGTAMGALFFSIAMGMALAPAIQGSAMNVQYNGLLKTSLPAALTRVADEATITALGNPRVLLSEPAMNALRDSMSQRNEGQALFKQTVEAIRSSLESGLRIVFVIAAITMLLAFLLIVTIPRIPLDRAE